MYCRKTWCLKFSLINVIKEVTKLASFFAYFCYTGVDVVVSWQVIGDFQGIWSVLQSWCMMSHLACIFCLCLEKHGTMPLIAVVKVSRGVFDVVDGLSFFIPGVIYWIEHYCTYCVWICDCHGWWNKKATGRKVWLLFLICGCPVQHAFLNPCLWMFCLLSLGRGWGKWRSHHRDIWCGMCQRIWWLFVVRDVVACKFCSQLAIVCHVSTVELWFWNFGYFRKGSQYHEGNDDGWKVVTLTETNFLWEYGFFWSNY